MCMCTVNNEEKLIKIIFAISNGTLIYENGEEKKRLSMEFHSFAVGFYIVHCKNWVQ
jgi:hypothetical protein